MYPSKTLPSIGQMRSKLYLITNTQAEDGAGGYSEAVQSSARSFWVYAEQVRGNEKSENNRTEREETWRFVGRYSEVELAIGKTLSFNGKELRVHKVEDLDQKKKFIEIIAVTTGATTSLSDDDGGGSDGTLPGGRFDADYGTEADPLEFYMQYDLFDLATGTQVEIINSGVCIIDWGDGNGVQSYATSPTIIKKTYQAGQFTDRQSTIKVYHNHNIGIHRINSPTGNTFCKVNSVGGTIPTSLVNFGCVGMALQTIPTLPAACKTITLVQSSIDEAQMNTFVAGLVTNAQNNGSLNINSQSPVISYDTANADMLTLVSRGWTVTPAPNE